MLLSLSLRTVVLVVIGLGRMVCSGFCVLLKIVLGCSLLCLCSLAGGGSSWCCCSIQLHCSGGIGVRLAHTSVLTIHDNAGGIKKWLSKLCSGTTTVLSEWTVRKTMCLIHIYCIRYIYIYIHTHTHST